MKQKVCNANKDFQSDKYILVSILNSMGQIMHVTNQGLGMRTLDLVKMVEFVGEWYYVNGEVENNGILSILQPLPSKTRLFGSNLRFACPPYRP